MLWYLTNLLTIKEGIADRCIFAAMRRYENLNEKKKDLASKIAEFCTDQNISAGDLSLRVKTDRELLQDILEGKYEDKELKVLEEIAAELGFRE